MESLLSAAKLNSKNFYKTSKDNPDSKKSCKRYFERFFYLKIIIKLILKLPLFSTQAPR